ncbi:MAG: toxin-antitoxin system YwqK family antitoxin [Bacteroidetes bacterium]|nr:toxin-antitoxin system YwqK family antitoxin [Bacteroidota bacterium]
MVADFTAHRVRLLSNILFAVFCSACHSSEKNIHAMTYVNANELSLQNRNGIIYNNDIPFTGKIFSLFPNTADTLETKEFNDGKENGEWKQYYLNKKLREVRYFDNGVKVKTLTRWWENGQLQFKCSFENGEYEGALNEWNENGVLVRAMHYKNGYEEGSQKMFYDNGKVRSNYIMKNGRRIGLLGTKNCVNVSDSIFK